MPAQEAVGVDPNLPNHQMQQPQQVADVAQGAIQGGEVEPNAEDEKEPEPDAAVIEEENYELQDEFINNLMADAQDSEAATTDELARVEQSTRWIVPKPSVSREVF